MGAKPVKTMPVRQYEALLFRWEDGNHPILSYMPQEYAEIWDGEERLFTMPTHDKNLLEKAVDAFEAGRRSGKVTGRIEIQSVIKKALGLPMRDIDRSLEETDERIDRLAERVNEIAPRLR
jgi:hypothetical protein